MSWRCPNCKGALTLNHPTYALVCENGHNFDRAKQGYYNLLLANKKNSKDPGDNAEMTNARHRFLRNGYFSPLAGKLCSIAYELFGHKSILQEKVFLDYGCGEGYYSRALTMHLSDRPLRFFGIDISKHAVKMASSQHKQMKQSSFSKQQFAVASNFDIPIPDQTVDFILSVFAPISDSEALRVLRSSGRLIRVLPGPNHLTELKNVIYDEAERHKQPKTLQYFDLDKEYDLSFDIELKDPQDTEHLLAMTPFSWRTKQLSTLNIGDILKHLTIDFKVQSFKVYTE